MCCADSGIGTGIIIPGILRAYKTLFQGGIVIGIELNGFGPESELNRNRFGPELHITYRFMQFACNHIKNPTDRMLVIEMPVDWSLLYDCNFNSCSQTHTNMVDENFPPKGNQ